MGAELEVLRARKLKAELEINQKAFMDQMKETQDRIDVLNRFIRETCTHHHDSGEDATFTDKRGWTMCKICNRRV